MSRLRNDTSQLLTLDAAGDYLRAGLSVLPIAPDGTKKPALDVVPKWGFLQSRLPKRDELAAWFGNGDGRGIGIIAGRVSGGLAILDFDDPEAFENWSALLKDQAPGLLGRLPVVKSPRGYHCYFRSEVEHKSETLARKAARGERAGLIELKAEGAYCLAPGSPRACHPDGKEYLHFSGPKIVEVPKLSEEEVGILLEVARALDLVPKTIVNPGPNGKGKSRGVRPGDEFNRTAKWEDILTPAGWGRVGDISGKVLWRRPGKTAGVSATTGHCTSETAGDLLYVFSSNADPFEANTAFSKFAAHALLEHGGDFEKAAKALARTEQRSKLFPRVEAWPDPVDGAELLREVERCLTDYLVLPAYASTVIAGWILAAWVVTAWSRFPHLALTSPQRRCGKTRSLELLRFLCPRALLATSISPAGIFRIVEKYKATLLVDEAQWLNDPKSDSARAIRELLSGGIERDAVSVRCCGDEHEPTPFKILGPKVIAMIGCPEAVLLDRCIQVGMQRKLPTETVKAWRGHAAEEEVKTIARKIARWSEDNRAALEAAYETTPPLPLANERLAELLLPLQVVIGAADPTRLGELESYARGLDTVHEDDQPEEIQLLAALRRLFDFDGAEFLPTLAITEGLKGPGKRSLASHLRKFGVHPRHAKDKSCRGYYRGDLVEVWRRFVPDPDTPCGETSETSRTSPGPRKRERKRARKPTKTRQK